jgi:hypothetical protein
MLDGMGGWKWVETYEDSLLLRYSGQLGEILEHLLDVLGALLNVLEAETVRGGQHCCIGGAACAEPIDDVALLADDAFDDGEFLD